MSRRAIKVELTPGGDVSEQLAGILKGYLAAVGGTARARTQQIIAEEVNDRSGKLRTRTNFRVKVVGRDVLLEFYNDAGSYAVYHEHGTGIYGPKKRMIRPKRAKVLTWVDPDTGERVFAREVRGVPPKNFMSKGIDFALKQVGKQYGG